MAYCSACGQQVEESALYCSKCGAGLNRATSAEPTPPEPTSPRRVLDVPEPPPWLGWLAVPAALAFYVAGIGVYCVWAYRRGKHDGFGAHTELAPSQQIGWATVGWSLALFVPILNWYALVHLPTMWYKHGMVVGASSDTAPSTFFTSVFGFVLVLAAAVIVAGGVLIAGSLSDGQGQAAPTPTLRPTARPTVKPTPAANFEVFDVLSLTQRWVSENSLLGFPQETNWVRCVTAEFRGSAGSWVVTCEFRVEKDDFEAKTSKTYLFDDRTGAVQ